MLLIPKHKLIVSTIDIGEIVTMFSPYSCWRHCL